MSDDPAERILPSERKSKDFIESCCLTPLLWSIDYSQWDTTNEVWGIKYYKTIKTIAYIGK